MDRSKLAEEACRKYITCDGNVAGGYEVELFLRGQKMPLMARMSAALAVAEAAIRADEREACARIAENEPGDSAGFWIARAIRARGERDGEN